MRKAISLVNSGGIIIYSTCSILKEENENILEKFKGLVEVSPIKIYEEKIELLSSLEGTLTVCPNEYYEGFFVAKLIKK